jgi:murein L,D-transpeptidase YcbB/YkuD
MAVQARVGVERDGILGPDSIRALQRHLSVRAVDGEIWNPSETVRALQRRLNAGKF